MLDDRRRYVLNLMRRNITRGGYVTVTEEIAKMDLTHEISNGLLVLRPKNRIDSATAQAYEAQFVALIAAGPGKAVIDLSDVDYISSAGLRVLLIAGKSARSSGGALTLCGASGSVREVIVVSGFDAILGAHDDVSAAAAALGA
jgi:anti-anti-sigma factor